MRFTILFSICLLTGLQSLHAQLPIRNFIFLGQDSLLILLEKEGMEYEIYSDAYDDSFGYDYDWEDEEVYYEDYGEEEEGIQEEELGIISEVPDPEPDEMLSKDSLSVDEEEVTISVYSSEAFGYTGNDASFPMRNDSCFLVQYNWYDDVFVLESLRKVMDQREDFTPCEDLKDCWIQQIPDTDARFYWNLFDQYEGEKYWKALRIEAEREIEENHWWYQFSEGKF